MWAEPAVTRYIGGRPFSRSEVWAKLLRYVGHWALLGFGYWVAEEKSSGRFAGEVGFADFKRPLESELNGLPEAGWVFASWAHGQGFANEALRHALAWGDAHLPQPRSFCLIEPDNAPSIRLAHKCGYEQIEALVYQGNSMLVFARG